MLREPVSHLLALWADSTPPKQFSSTASPTLIPLSTVPQYVWASHPLLPCSAHSSSVFAHSCSFSACLFSFHVSKVELSNYPDTVSLCTTFVFILTSVSLIIQYSILEDSCDSRSRLVAHQSQGQWFDPWLLSMCQSYWVKYWTWWVRPVPIMTVLSLVRFCENWMKMRDNIVKYFRYQ